MFGLEHIADMFDKIHEDNKRSIQSGFQDWVNDIYKSDGENWKFYGAAVTAGTLDALYTVAGGMGSGLVDTLRLGEGVKEGTAWGVAKDGLRVITIVGGAFRVARVAAAELKLGAATTCTISSSTKAAVISGNSARPFMLFDRMAQLFGGRAAVMSKNFAGTATPMEMEEFFRVVGTPVSKFKVNNLKDVAEAVQQAKGPVVFGVRWANGGGHTMVGFRNLLGQVRYADQFGRTISDVSKLGSVASVYGEGMLVYDSAVVQALRWGAVGQFMAAPLHTLPPGTMRQVEQHVRGALGQPMPGAHKPPAIQWRTSAPNVPSSSPSAKPGGAASGPRATRVVTPQAAPPAPRQAPACGPGWTLHNAGTGAQICLPNGGPTRSRVGRVP